MTPARFAVPALSVAALALAACGGEPPAGDEPAPPTETASHEAAPQTAPDPAPAPMDAHAGAQEHDDIGALARPLRLAFMSGHVEAGLALYRAGAPDQAASHLLHPVSETHASERAGLDELGFDASLFETVSEALDAGRPASEIEPQLAAAQTNLAMVAERAGGDPVEIITFLMDVIVEEYAIAITDGAVSDPGEYQDAYGFAVVARQRADALPDEVRAATLAELDALIALWPDGAPLPPHDPTAVAEIVGATSRVLLAMS